MLSAAFSLLRRHCLSDFLTALTYPGDDPNGNAAGHSSSTGRDLPRVSPSDFHSAQFRKVLLEIFN